MAILFFVYGLAFFSLGLVVAIYPKSRSSYWLAKNLWLIAAFSLLHGLNEWVDMLLIVRNSPETTVLTVVRTILLPLSFLFLVQFGTNGVLDLKLRYRRLRMAPGVLAAAWAIMVSVSDRPLLMADIGARYLLAAPGIFLTAYSFMAFRATLEIPANEKPRSYLNITILGLLLYGFVAGMIVPDAGFFPASVLNYTHFRDAVGVPAQAVRALCAVLIAYGLIRVLTIFDLEMKETLIRARDGLDLKVRERTQELIGVNRELEQEIADRRRTEVLLKQERDRARDYLNVAGVIMLALDPDGTVNMINRKGCDILGYPEQEIIGRNWFELALPADEREETRNVFRRMMTGSIALFETHENAIVTGSGERRTIAWHNTLLRDRSSAIIGSLSSGEDITERKRAEEARRESEERYRDLFENANDAIFIVDAGLNYIDANKKAEELFGYPRQEILRMNILDVIPPEQNPRSKRELEKLKNKQSYDKFVGKMRARDGRWLDIEVSSSPIVRDGMVVGSRDIVRDITERRRLEEELMKREKLESLGVLAGGLAHDFNNLLTGIMGNLSMARMFAGHSDKLLTKLTEAEKASQRARDLTQQLLTFSKGGAPVKATVDLERLIRETASFSLSGSRVTCLYRMADTLWSADVDAGQIGQVISNLIINADQAMPEGGAITITGENVVLEPGSMLSLKEGPYVRISIRDQGAGIRAEHLPKIFDPYFTTKQKGSGLGLASSYSIVQRHEGHLAVESVLGSGTTFHLYLPANAGTRLEDTRSHEGVLHGEGTVLVVDDEEMIRTVAGEMLKAIGYEVEFASDGGEAVQRYQEALLANRPFAAVIMDLTMPGGMGGKEAIAKLKEIDPGVRAIVSSGYSQDPVVAHFRTYGFAGVVSKPYELSSISAVLHQVISGAGAEDVSKGTDMGRGQQE